MHISILTCFLDFFYNPYMSPFNFSFTCLHSFFGGGFLKGVFQIVACAKLKARTDFPNVWGKYKNHSNPYIQGTTVSCDTSLHCVCSLSPRPSRAPVRKRVWYITSDFLVVLSQHVREMGNPIRLPDFELSCDMKAI